MAVNHGQLKNNIGAFYQPKLVIADISTLKTCRLKSLENGLAEVIKYGVILDQELFQLHREQSWSRLKSLDEELLEEVISRCAGIKAEIVEKDEKDLGLRNILNFGHTSVMLLKQFRISKSAWQSGGYRYGSGCV